ncbi:glycosyltransferase family 1 protein [Xylogone sp. PMI_703]|nr:glycosyltransferase family 1 protein [Xylogone sp. PMI_703]
MSSDVKGLERECFVTVGATAGFPQLIQAILTEESLQALKEAGYTRLTLQCGPSLSYFQETKPTGDKTFGLNINAFDFNKKGLGQEMRSLQAKEGKNAEGLVISHAGTGTILDTLRLGLPLIVVPNASLLDNHQEELAVELARQRYCVKSDISGLPKAIRKIDSISKKKWAAAEHASVKTVIDGMIGYEEDVFGRLD